MSNKVAAVPEVKLRLLLSLHGHPEFDPGVIVLILNISNGSAY